MATGNSRYLQTHLLSPGKRPASILGDARTTQGGQIELVVETAYAAQVVGPARLWVRAYPEEAVRGKLRGSPTGRDDELSEEEWECLLEDDEGVEEVQGG